MIAGAEFQTGAAIIAAPGVRLGFAGRVTNGHYNSGDPERRGRFLLEVGEAVLDFGLELVLSLLESALDLLF